MPIISDKNSRTRPNQRVSHQGAQRPKPPSVSSPMDARQPAANNVYRTAYPVAGKLPPPPPAPRQTPRRRSKSQRKLGWLWGSLLALVGLGVASVLAIMLVLQGVYSAGILPAVSFGEKSLAGMDIPQATRLIEQQWQTVTLVDDDRQWQSTPDLLGLTLDAAATAENAYAIGRERGNGLQAIFGDIQVDAVIDLDVALARSELERIAPQVTIDPQNARIGWQNNNLVALPAQYGRVLDIDATLQAWQTELDDADKTFALSMRDVAPAILDVQPLLDNARALLLSPMTIRLFDPVTGDQVDWSVAPQQWNAWVDVLPDSSNDNGVLLQGDESLIREYLVQEATARLDGSRSLAFDRGVASVVEAIRQGELNSGYVQVTHRERTHVVQAGESITSIAWDYGMPYPYIQEANGGLQGVDVGQSIIIPPADSFLLKPVIPNKRIIVSISQQRTWVYQDGQLIHDWASSTGISDSPTWKGIYQIISHDPNAYAGNWDLWMPYFLGVYQPIPNSPFTNGFHGFPTRGGGQLLWENSLGQRVTYGCILLNNANASWLYNWAEDGVVVEIRG